MDYITDELGGTVTEARYGQTGGRITVTNAPAETPEEPEAADWADVDADAWYAEAVHYVIENGIMGSTSTEAKVFTPNGMVTRATVFQTLYNAQGKPEVGETTFADVEGKWYASAAAWAEEVGLAVVPTDGGFYGERAITRAEIATIFARYAELEGKIVTDGDLSAYTDVAEDAWYADAISWAAGEGIVSGYGDTFGPNDPITREQLAAILYRYAQNEGYKTSQSGKGTEGYLDASSISSYAVKAMDWAVNAGLLSGKGNNTLAPTAGATRAEVAQIFMNFCENIAK